MEPVVYFGISFDDPLMEDPQDVAARLFLCPRISAEYASTVLSLLSSGTMPIPIFRSITDDGIKELKGWMEEGKRGYALDVMRNKLRTWISFLGSPAREDYVYMERSYGFSKKDLFEEIDHQIPTERLRMEESFGGINCPKDMADIVKQYIKGQDDAIEKLAVPFFLHYESIVHDTPSCLKTPTVVIGPTGSGKSETLRRYAELCDNVPVLRFNLGSLTAEGWTGTGITDVIAHEISNGTDIRSLERAIFIFHEFDKITHYGVTSNSSTGQTSVVDMINNLMRFFETDYEIPITMPSKLETYKLPVDNLMIIFDGAFEGMEEIIRKRLHLHRSIGFTQNDGNPYADVNMLSLIEEKDLISWGYTPELVGRIGDVVVLNALTPEVLYEILTTAKDSILQSQINYFSDKNIDLRFNEGALRLIADVAYRSSLGFRNARTLLYKTLRGLMYEIPSEPLQERKEIMVSEEFVRKSLNFCN